MAERNPFVNYSVDSMEDNLSLNTTTTVRPQEDKTLRNVITICCYTLIVCVSLCGNLLVCKVAFGKRKMRTTTNMLIASLACSDIVMTTFNIPFNVARLLLLDWPFGSVLCFLVPFIQTSCVYVSTFTMTVIAVHRWWTVTKRTTSRTFSCNRLILVVIIIWLLAATLSLPHSIFNEIKQANVYGKIVNRCRVTHPKVNFDIPLFLSVEVFITQYLTPLFITLVVYVKIGFVVSKQGKILAASSDNRRRQQSEAKRRRIIMLALVVCVFATCWLPLNVYHLLVDFKIIKHHFTLFLVCHWFAMSSVCYNPFIYCWLNESFRKGAKKFFLLFFKCRKSKNSHNPIETHEEDNKLHTTVSACDGKRTSV